MLRSLLLTVGHRLNQLSGDAFYKNRCVHSLFLSLNAFVCSMLISCAETLKNKRSIQKAPADGGNSGGNQRGRTIHHGASGMFVENQYRFITASYHPDLAHHIPAASCARTRPACMHTHPSTTSTRRRREK